MDLRLSDPMIQIKRVYQPPDPADGRRVLVDRLWPRGVSTEAARLDEWRKEVAPSDELRRWFGHDPDRYREFRTRYRAELDPHRELLRHWAEEGAAGTLTLVFAARDATHSNAAVLKELLDEMAP